MSEVPENIIDRIKKLLAMAESPNEFEAQRASEKAQELLTLHNLTLAHLNQPEGIQSQDVLSFKRSIRWKESLLTAVAQFYDCLVVSQRYAYQGTGKQAKIVSRLIGSPSNSTVALLMFEYFCRAIDRVYAEARHRNPNLASQSFRFGAVLQINRKLCDRKEQIQSKGFQSEGSPTSAIAIRDQSEAEQARVKAWVEALTGEPLEAKEVKRPIDRSVRAGFRAGQNIGIESQVTGNKRLSPARR
jgi:Protein of unknown function (DUF2786)